MKADASSKFPHGASHYPDTLKNKFTKNKRMKIPQFIPTPVKMERWEKLS